MGDILVFVFTLKILTANKVNWQPTNRDSDTRAVMCRGKVLETLRESQSARELEHSQIHTWTYTELCRHRQTDRQTDIHTHIHTETHTWTQTHGDTHRHTQTH